MVTSSAYAIFECDRDKVPEKYDETMWSNPDLNPAQSHYSKSKVLAEKAAWDFLKSLPEDERFEMVTICPGFVMGTAIAGASTATSC